MSKCSLVKLLRNEIQNLNHLVASLEDESKLCCPNEYDCSICLKEVVSNLRKIEKRVQKALNYEHIRSMFGILKI